MQNTDPTLEALRAVTDRPVEQFTEINPPPHETIPEQPVDEASRMEAQTGIEQLRAEPPPVPHAAAAQMALAQEAIAAIRAASRNRCAFISMLSAFNSQVNLMYQALGELNEEDFAHFPRTMGHLVLAVDLLQARLSSITLATTARAEAAE